MPRRPQSGSQPCVEPMPRLTTLRPRVATLDTRAAPPAPKTADPYYLSAEHRAWADDVKRRAGFRCEYVEAGQRCAKAAPRHRMFADHIVERRDGGADQGEGQCLCGAHHSLVTARRRAERLIGNSTVRP